MHWWRNLAKGLMKEPVEVSWLVGRGCRGDEIDPDASRRREVTSVDLIAYYPGSESGQSACCVHTFAREEDTEGGKLITQVELLDSLLIHGQGVKWAAGITVQLEEFERGSDDGYITALWGKGAVSVLESQEADDVAEVENIEGYDLISLFVDE